VADRLIRHTVRSFSCTVVSGPERGQSFALDATAPFRTLIGTSPACGIRLSDAKVSRRHAALELTSGELRLRDLGSTNGTRLQGVSIIEALLQGGEQIEIGGTVLRIDALAAGTELRQAASFRRLMGVSPEMSRVYAIARLLAASDVPTIIEGETGTGKELLAESIHEASGRAGRPFVVIDCTTLAASLIESELFGHERGAFTGAVGTRKGVFEQAHTGTLFIDEIGDLDLGLQAKLLRAIERCELRRVGGNEWVRVDVRIIAATRRNLDRQVQLGQFRDDLFYRLAVGRIELPPLRHRTGDVTFLAKLFWSELGGHGKAISPGFVERLEQQAWPGNVRELQNHIARVLAMGDELLESSPPSPEASAAEADFLDGVLATGLPIAVGRQRVVDEYERRYVARVLEAHGGHVGNASAASGISRRYFQRIRSRFSPR
jgi:transcriptional regulator with GAF, ATPase, and Fis domain